MIVIKYSPEEFCRLLAEHSESDEAFLKGKAQKLFLEGYLNQLGAQTIVVEPCYTDRDYLQDFAGYYVSCFHAYKRTTTRIHFFSNDFQLESFSQLLSGDESQLTESVLRESYLGFIVVKPLPKTIIGRTCLKTYPSDNDRRHFPVLQEYSANLFGLALKIKSLAFQEQDSVAAACATSALWACFHVTGRNFHHPLLSPTDITKAALVSLPTSEIPDTRAFPNRGLTPTQMANAVNAVGLDPQIIGAKNDHLVKSTLYAYLRGKIPILLGIRLIETLIADPDKVRPIGQHAVAVGGYSTGGTQCISHGPTEFKLFASRIDKFYVHDDQLGPFSRMKFLGINVDNCAMSTEWKSDSDLTNIIALTKIILLPLYRKIRIPFEIIHDTILELDALINIIQTEFFPTIGRFEWDIYLTTVNDFKAELITKVKEFGENSETALTTPLPKFMWRATGLCDGVVACDFLFDATGIEQSSLLLIAKIYSPDLMAILQALASDTAAATLQTFHVLESIAANSKAEIPLIFEPLKVP